MERAERRAKAEMALEQAHVGHLAKRGIHQLSGGEQQRVALARALAFTPKVLLLDEPLSALDAKLREELRADLGRLLNELSLTTIYVTHDQVEAMSLGHELIIMREGRIEQAGTPVEVYIRPATAFVATFLGSANLLDGECVQVGGETRLRLPMADLPAPAGVATGPCRVMLRPEDLTVVEDGCGHLRGEVASAVFLGNQARLVVKSGGCALSVDAGNETMPSPGSQISLRVSEHKVCILP